MPAAARASGIDTVFSLTGVGRGCRNPMNTVTGEGSSNVFVNGYGVVRENDEVGDHPANGCGPDNSPLTTFSSKVFINGRRAGRIGDKYTNDNTITSGSTNVFIGD
jgi:uncharacterized Zn-binding protein involved in type VI secretion